MDQQNEFEERFGSTSTVNQRRLEHKETQNNNMFW